MFVRFLVSILFIIIIKKYIMKFIGILLGFVLIAYYLLLAHHLMETRDIPNRNITWKTFIPFYSLIKKDI